MKRISTLLLAIFIGITICSATEPATPDFAFPEKVSANAQKRLTEALATGDGPMTVRALIDYGLAKGAIDTDNLPEVINRIDEVRHNGKISDVTQSVLSLLLADIYNQIYQKQRWIYDERSLPLTPYPADYNEWSGEQFRRRVTELVDTTLTATAALQQVPIADWSTVIDYNTDDAACFPTLYEFTAYNALSLLNAVAPADAVFTINWMVPFTVYRDLKFPYTTPEARRILEIYRELDRCNSDRPSALIYADLKRIEFISQRLSGTGQPGKTADDLQLDLLTRFPDQPMAGYIILQMYNRPASTAERSVLYKYAMEWLQNPLTSGAPAKLRKAVEALTRTLTQQEVKLSFRPVSIPGQPINITVKSNNTRSASIAVYRLPDTYRYGDNLTKITIASMRKIASLPVNFNGEGVFTDTTSVSVDLPGYGNYIIAPVMPGKTFSARKLSTNNILTVTDILLTSGSLGNNYTAFALSPVYGAPIEGVNVILKEAYNSQGIKATGKTDQDGRFSFSVNDTYSSNNLWGSKGADKFSRPLNIYTSYYGDDRNWEKEANAYTDLALYHPGDTARFAAVVYEYRKENHRLITNKEVKAMLFDANNQKIDSVTATTDDWGRVEGSFALPTDGLTGMFRISLGLDNKNLTNCSFTVSDYKLPTYEIRVYSTRRDTPAKGDVTISARAVTYSGFPVSGASVTAGLSVTDRGLWWWRSRGINRPFYSAEGTTDSDGNVTFTFPAGLLADAPISNGIFTASITITSATGESHETPVSFTQGPACMIDQSFPSKFDISGNRVKLPVKVTDLDGNTMDTGIRWQLVSEGRDTLTGTFNSTNPEADWHSVKSGRYTVTLSPVDSALANPVTSPEIILYRKSDKMPPVNTPLWIPVHDYQVPQGHKAKVSYGTSVGDSHMWCTLWASDTIIWQKWVDPAPGIHTMDVELPAGVKSATLTISTIHDYEQTVENVKLQATDIARSLNISIESLRDHITPGDHEQWTVTVTDNTGRPAEAAMIFDMYAKALDTLSPASWQFPVQNGYGLRYGTLTQPYTGLSTPWANLPVSGSYYFRINQPDFLTYGRKFTTSNGIRIRGTMGTGAVYASYASVDAVNVVREHKKEALVEEVLNTVQTCDMALAECETDAGGGAEAGQKSADEYRMPEMPLAFFRPMLTTGNDGRMQFSFTAPNANTTWRLCALTFSRDLLTGSLEREIISSKPVMVQPNLPRFLRTGDRATVLASVMNNTDTTAVISTVIGLFDPISGNNIATSVTTDTITAKGSATAEITIAVPADATMIGYRVRATCGTFTDGEQAVIPVLPSVTPVIDSKPFYMAPDSTSIAVKLPEMPDDSHVTLQFCQNPAWYCVTALPGLRADDSKSALSASAAIFSAAIADGLMREHPEISKAIKMWQESDRSDSTLVSMLERNQDLKTVLLSSTPWMMDARSDTERMARLALLFDRKEIERTYSTNIDLLTKLNAGGGWKWIGQSKEPSLWITYNVLGMMGRLKQLGYLPADNRLRTMITNAVKYIDSEAAKQYAKYPQGDYTDYVYTRLPYSDISRSTAATRVTSATVQRLVKNWRNADVTGKAIAAMILNANRYKTLSRQVLASIDEYSKQSAERGMWWPSLDDYTGWTMGKIGATSTILDAYRTIQPDAPEIDRIRQWLILQKEAKDWGTSVTTSAAIASILNSGTRWTVPAEGVVIKLGGKAIQPAETDKMTGYFRTDISALQPSGATLTVDKSSAGPAWGAVYCRYISDMQTVKPSGCDGLNISKELFVQRNTISGTEWERTDTLHTGERVKVQLTVRATRDMDYVAIIDDRAACMEPTEQMPEPIYSEGLCFYRENRDASTRMFVTHLPKGTYLLTYELWVNNAGQYASGITSAQSQYAPQLSAHSGGATVNVLP